MTADTASAHPNAPGPLHRLDPDTRRERARAWVGRYVEIDHDPQRRGGTTAQYRGWLISVAVVALGNTSDILVIRVDSDRYATDKDLSFSLAQIATITPLPNSEARR